MVGGGRAAQQSSSPASAASGSTARTRPEEPAATAAAKLNSPRFAAAVPDRVSAPDRLGGKPYQRRVDPRHAAPEVAQPASEDT